VLGRKRSLPEDVAAPAKREEAVRAKKRRVAQHLKDLQDCYFLLSRPSPAASNPNPTSPSTSSSSSSTASSAASSRYFSHSSTFDFTQSDYLSDFTSKLSKFTRYSSFKYEIYSLAMDLFELDD
jgi:hypothetical protein